MKTFLVFHAHLDPSAVVSAEGFELTEGGMLELHSQRPVVTSRDLDIEGCWGKRLLIPEGSMVWRHRGPSGMVVWGIIEPPTEATSTGSLVRDVWEFVAKDLPHRRRALEAHLQDPSVLANEEDAAQAELSRRWYRLSGGDGYQDELAPDPAVRKLTLEILDRLARGCWAGKLDTEAAPA